MWNLLFWDVLFGMGAPPLALQLTALRLAAPTTLQLLGLAAEAWLRAGISYPLWLARGPRPEFEL